MDEDQRKPLYCLCPTFPIYDGEREGGRKRERGKQAGRQAGRLASRQAERRTCRNIPKVIPKLPRARPLNAMAMMPLLTGSRENQDKAGLPQHHYLLSLQSTLAISSTKNSGKPQNAGSKETKCRITQWQIN